MPTPRHFLVLLAFSGLFACSPTLLAQPAALFGQDLRVRPGGAKDFTPETPRIGVETIHDPASNAMLFITETGAISAVPFGTPGAKKPGDWAFALDVRLRKADEVRFTADTRKLGIEVFKDSLSGRLLYVSENKTIAAVTLPVELKTDREPSFHHGMSLNIRPANETDWKKAKPFGVEVYRDGNTGGLLYISQTGFLAAYPAPDMAPGDNPKAAKSLYGLTLRIRKADETEFTSKTPSIAVEVFSDPNTGALIYISETGSLAAVVPPAQLKAESKPRWTHAMKLRSRKGGDKNFTAAAPSFGVESFIDQTTGYRLLVTETGSLAVITP
ncbi:MAG: hypothetical protein ACRCZF_04695 [Gemmataceae bacterium]